MDYYNILHIDKDARLLLKPLKGSLVYISKTYYDIVDLQDGANKLFSLNFSDKEIIAAIAKEEEKNFRTIKRRLEQIKSGNCKWLEND